MFNFFKSNKVSVSAKTLQPISPEMTLFYQAIKNHLEMNTAGALLITGDWGSGKTYFMKKILFPSLEKETEIKPILVSLYGAVDKNAIAKKVFMAYLDKLGNNQPISAANLTKSAYNILESFTWLKSFVDVNKLFADSGEDLFRFLPKNGLLICFDDLERISEKINPEDFLGMVNELVENRRNKVIIIANEGTIDGGIKYKEKTIEKTIHFKNDQGSILDNIAATYTDTSFGSYLTTNKAFIIQTLDPIDHDGTEINELKILFSNIRSLKFAIEHFRYVFEIFDDKTDINLPSVQNQLKGIWAFVLAVTIEFKKNDSISYTERKKLDTVGEPLSTDELAKLLWGNNQEDNEVEEPNEKAFREKFIKQYFTRIGIEYKYSSQVYDLLTSGKSIDPDPFIADIGTQYHVTNGVINPAHDLLSRFLHQGYWRFTNEDFLPSLNLLLAYVREGAFEEILGYLNAASFLISFSEVMDIGKEELTGQIKAGINIASGKINIEGAFNQLDMASDGFNEEHLKEIFEYALERFKVAQDIHLAEETARLEQLFYNNLDEFFKQLESENTNIIIPESRLFDQFSTAGLQVAINNWQPAEMYELVKFLNRRYFRSGFEDKLTTEIPFLESFAERLTAFENPNKILSGKLISHQLLPKVQKSIQRLQSFLKPPAAEVNES